MAMWLAAALVSMVQAATPMPPRLVPFVAVTQQGDIELRIDNPSREPLDAVFVVELVLDRRDRFPPPDIPSPVPSYRARLDLTDSLVASSKKETRVRVAAGASRRWVTSAARLPWHEHLSAVPIAPRSFIQVVPPGDYSLALRLSQGESPWWYSKELAVASDGRGRLTLRRAEGQ
jgi:hypothetical protein